MSAARRLRFVWRALHYRWRGNRREIAFLRARVRAGDVAVDVGAHKGGFLYWLRAGVGASGAVWAFEPQPALAAYLADLVALQGWSNVTIEPAALSSREGTMELHVPGPAGSVSPGASLVPGGEEGLRHSLRVPVKTLDAYRAARTDRRVGFIKCDCEGHELEVFRGAVELLRRDRPALLFECEQRHLPGASPATVFDFLRALGYRGWFFHASGLLPVAEFRVEVHQPVRPGRYWDAKDYYNNFAFVPADEGSQERDK